MNIRRKNRLWVALAVIAGLTLTTALVPYALRSSIELFYTPGVSVCASAGWSRPAA